MLSNNSCKDCYYYDLCSGRKVCDDFYPITEDAEDSVIAENIEISRREFHAEFEKYANQYIN